MLASGCGQHSCLSGAEGCRVPVPCQGLRFECATGRVALRVLAAGDPIPGGIDALASPGDIVLENDQLTAVIDALDHPHYVAPTGGNLLDLASASGDDDSLTHVFQAAGLLPDDSVAYERLETEQGDGWVAVQVVGHLAGHPSAIVATRYELHACEPGLRVRTELYNGTPDPRSWVLVDAWYWSGRETLPFAPPDGFEQDGLVSPVERSWQPTPFMAAAAHTTPSAVYAAIACNQNSIYAAHTEQLSAVGRRPRIVAPRDFEIYERFITVAPGRSVASAADVALEVRRQLFREPWAELSGTIEGANGDEVRATVLLREASGAAWTQVTPDASGRFTARVPASRRYTLEVHAFGRVAASREVEVGTSAADAGTIALDPPATLTVAVTVDGDGDYAQVYLHPADDATRDAVGAHFFGGFFECAPLLGSSIGGSPACNRILVRDPVTIEAPPGRYDVYATIGPFATLDVETVELREGQSARVDLALSRLDVAPAGTLAADFHVHGGASFDSSIPDFDRVQAWLAADMDVITTTDHDVAWDYAEARRALDAGARLNVMVGTEATGHILFDLVPGADVPQVIGHWNVWPLQFDLQSPYRGAPWDELAEPGALFDRFVLLGWPEDSGVFQLNHPWNAAQFGRDLGFPRAVGVDANVPLPREDDGTGPAMILRTPPGARLSNGDYHTQEVMNGTANEDLQAHRAYWFYLLDQGIVRAGTANSDSHGLVDNQLGTPRTLVWTSQVHASFDEAAFNRDVRGGHMVGTNGPVIELETTDASGAVREPGVTAFAPDPNGNLRIRVVAAPWVPVDEVRVVVDGEVARTLSAELSQPSDPFGTEGLVRFDGQIALREILPPGTRDAWIVVEAGIAIPISGDLDCNGIPDTGDNDGDGAVDWRDVDRNGDRVIDAEDREEIGGVAPRACDPDQDLGPLGRGPRPSRGEPGYPFLAVSPESWPFAFTNPLLLDRDGGGFDGPGLGAP